VRAPQHHDVYRVIADEFTSTVAGVKQVAQIDALLEENPSLSRSISRRRPYIDPINHIQVRMLKRYRSAVCGNPSRTPGSPR